MKRSGFKQKKTKPLKKCKLKTKSKQKISVLKRKLWKVFSQYIRTRDKGVCFICNRKAEGSGYHAGHFIPKSVGGITLYFHEENVRGCCYNCNINLGGNLYEFGMKLGSEKVAELYALKQKSIKVDENWYQEKINHYTKLLENLNSNETRTP